MMNKKTALGIAICAGLVLTTGSQATDDGFAAGLASEGRPAADRDRDANRKPDQVLEWLGVESGMTVMDVFAAGGYYTEALSHAVGPNGKVVAQNAPRMAKIRGGSAVTAINERAERLGNIEPLYVDFFTATPPPGAGAGMGMGGAMMGPAEAGPQIELGNSDDYAGTIDIAITALNFHDAYIFGGEEGASSFAESVFKVLKPGGVVGVIDHAGIAGQDNSELHRIEKEMVIGFFTSAGFEIEAESDILANPGDDHMLNMRDESIAGKTDRMLIKARKP
jgi:predicted methyltransferase